MLIVYRRCRTSQIIDFIHFSPIWLTNIMANYLKIRTTYQMPYIFLASCIEIIKTDNIITFIY